MPERETHNANARQQGSCLLTGLFYWQFDADLKHCNKPSEQSNWLLDGLAPGTPALFRAASASTVDHTVQIQSTERQKRASATTD